MDEYRAQIDAAVDRTVDYLGSAEALNSVIGIRTGQSGIRRGGG